MSFKTTYWLFGILLVILTLLGVALWLDPLPVDLDSFLFPTTQDKKNALTSDKVVRVLIERTRPTAETLTFERDPKFNRWRLKTASGEVEAEASVINQIANDLLRLQRASKATLGAPDKHGLNPPEATVTLVLAGDATLTLKIGDSTVGDKSSLAYVQSSERSTVLAVKKSDLDKMTRSEAFYRDRDPLVAQVSSALGLKISHTVAGKEKEPTVELTRSKDRWGYLAPFKGDADNLATETKMEPGQPPKNVAALLDQLLKFRVEFTDDKSNDFVASGVTDWAKYGLESAGDLLTLEVARAEQANPTLPDEGAKPSAAALTSKATLVIAIGKKVDEKTEKYYARRAGESVVFKVAAAPVAALLELLKNPEAVRDRHLLTLDSERRVPNVLTLKGEGTDLEFFKRDKDRPWQLYRGSATKPSNLDENIVKGALALLGQDRMIEAFPDMATVKEADLGFDKGLVASFWVDGIAEPKKDDSKEKEQPKVDLNARPALKDAAKPTARLTFGKRNREKKTVYVKRELPDEAPAFFEIREVLYERLSDSPLVYLDRKLPQFREGTEDVLGPVNRVLFTLKGKTTEITRAKETDPWKIVQPKELEGRLVDSFGLSTMLGALNRLTAAKYLVEKATPAQLTADYGLNPAAEKAEITLTREGKPLTYEFLFGKEATEGGSIFAKFGGAFNDDTVFTLDKATLNLFDRELLDLGVFNFPVSKVKEISLKGWYSQAGEALQLVVAPRGDGWEMKVGPKEDFVLDEGKVVRFLAQLSNLRAEKFISHGKTPNPAQNLNIQLGALSIWITLEGETEPLKLLIGEADGQSYFATSTKLPGDVFLVPKTTFEGPRNSRGFFKK